MDDHLPPPAAFAVGEPRLQAEFRRVAADAAGGGNRTRLTGDPLAGGGEGRVARLFPPRIFNKGEYWDANWCKVRAGQKGNAEDCDYPSQKQVDQL